MSATFNMAAAAIQTKDSSAWDFFDIDSSDNNASFFDDSFTYIERETPNVVGKSTKLILFIFIGLVVISGGILAVLRLNSNKDYQNLNNIATMYDTNVQTGNYVEGIEANSEVIIEVDKIMQMYSNALHSSNFTGIDTVCLNSQLGTTYTNTKNNISTVYDQNDGLVRIFDYLFSTFDYTVDKVVYNESSDTYFCYVDITAPTVLDAQSYIQSNSYLITKFFNNHDITAANIVNCLDNQVFSSSNIKASVTKVCFEATLDNNGNLILLTDAPLYIIYNDTYTQLLNTTMSIMKNGTLVGKLIDFTAKLI